MTLFSSFAKSPPFFQEKYYNTDNSHRKTSLERDVLNFFFGEDLKIVINLAAQDTAFFDLNKLPKLEYLKGKTAVIAQEGHSNYYHWMVEVLPKLALLEEKISPMIDSMSQHICHSCIKL